MICTATTSSHEKLVKTKPLYVLRLRIMLEKLDLGLHDLKPP